MFIQVTYTWHDAAAAAQSTHTTDTGPGPPSQMHKTLIQYMHQMFLTTKVSVLSIGFNGYCVLHANNFEHMYYEVFVRQRAWKRSGLFESRRKESPPPLTEDRKTWASQCRLDTDSYGGL